MRCRAVIFDMDGLMLDTERLRQQLFERVVAEHGMTLPDRVYLQTIGRTVRESRLIFAEHMGADFPFEALRLKRREIEYAYLAIHNLFQRYALGDSTVTEWIIANQALASIDDLELCGHRFNEALDHAKENIDR